MKESPLILTEFELLDAEIQKHMGSVREVARLAHEIKERELWKAKFESWNDYCKERFGKTADAFRKLEWRDTAKRLIAETTHEKAEPRTKSASNSSEPKPERKPIEVSARVDTASPPPAMHKPPEIPRVEQLSVSQKMEAIERDLDRLSHKQLSIDDLKIVCRVLFAVKEVRQLLQPTLPMEVESSKKRSKGTLEDVMTYCVLVRLTREDGEWFFHKCVGCGWKNNGLPINDWQATVNAWRIQKIFPSQKNQTYGSQTNRGHSPQNSRNEGTTPRPEGQPDYGEAARRKQELQSSNAPRKSGVA